MCKKLRDLKDNIKMCNKEVFGKIDENREALSREVEKLNREGETRDFTPDKFEAKIVAIRKIWDLNRWEAISWRQKSRISWLKEGD